MSHAIEVEIERNYAAFKDLLGSLLTESPGQYALLHQQRLVGLFQSPGEAERAGFKKFGEDPYSIQLVSDEPVDLGFYSYAMAKG
jgi:hypothetical protein